MANEKINSSVYLKGYLGGLPTLVKSDEDAKNIAASIEGGLMVKVATDHLCFSFGSECKVSDGKAGASGKLTFKDEPAFYDFLNGKKGKFKVSGRKAAKIVPEFEKLTALLSERAKLLSVADAEMDEVAQKVRASVFGNSIVALTKADKAAKLSLKYMTDGMSVVVAKDADMRLYFYLEEGELKLLDGENGTAKTVVTFGYLRDAVDFLSGRCDLSEKIMTGEAALEGDIANAEALSKIGARVAPFYGGVI